MSRITALLTLLIFLCGQPFPLAAATKSDSGFTLLYSNSLNGETDPCG